MKCFSVVCVLSAFIAVSLAAPTTLEESEIHNQVKRQTDNSAAINRIITYSNNKLQLLRRFCPQLFQIIDNVIQNVTSQVFRVVGGALLRSGGLGGGGSSGGGQVSVVLPTFPPDDEEDDEDEEENKDDVDTRIGGSSTTTTSANALSANVAISSSINEIDGDSELVSTNVISTPSSSSSSTTTTTTTTTSPTTSTSAVHSTESITPMLFTSPSVESETVKRQVRKPREVNDQEAAASGGVVPDPADDLSNVDAEDADRDKRFLPFGGDGSSGGSGNFLYDLFRLVIGSGATEESDEKEAGVGGVAEVDVSAKADAEGIPGPITRLLVIANRGIANLIQDLILRLAQTSERIINFKARLVTALI